MNKKTKKTIFGFATVLPLVCIGFSSAALAVSNRQDLVKFNQVDAAEKVLVEDFANPQFASNTLHTVDGQTYVDLVCSDAAVNGASLVMQKGSTAEAAVMGVTKLSVTFSGSLSVSIATVANKYYVKEELASATEYVFPFTANFLKLEAGTETTITRIEYSYACEVAPTLLTNPTNTALTSKTTGTGGDGNAQGKCYDFWEKNSGVHYNTTTKSTKLSISFALKSNKEVYNNNDVYYGDNKEMFFQIHFYVYDESTKENVGTFYVNIFKWSTTYVGARIVQNKSYLIDYKSTQAGNMSTKMFQDISTENGGRYVMDFDGPKVAMYYNNDGTMIKLGESSSLAHYNGKGTEQIRFIDYKLAITGSEESPSTVTLSNFQIAYGFQGGSGKLVKA